MTRPERNPGAAGAQMGEYLARAGTAMSLLRRPGGRGRSAEAAWSHPGTATAAVTVPAEVEELTRWVATHTDAPVIGWTAAPLTGGAVAAEVTLLTARTTDGAEYAVVRKRAPWHEIRALTAAQRVRAAGGGVIPELVASGTDVHGPWLVTPYYRGAPLAGRPAPDGLFAALAHSHAAFLAEPVAGVPTVDAIWWQALLQDWALPQLHAARGKRPAALIDHAVGLLADLAHHPVVPEALACLPATLLHGDVHPGNVLIADGAVRLIDWGSARHGPAALDLANLTSLDSPEMDTYRATWEQITGRPPDPEALTRGFRWATLQIPVQYLPWIVGNRTTDDLEATLGAIEKALTRLP